MQPRNNQILFTALFSQQLVKLSSVGGKLKIYQMQSLFLFVLYCILRLFFSMTHFSPQYRPTVHLHQNNLAPFTIFIFQSKLIGKQLSFIILFFS